MDSSNNDRDTVPTTSKNIAVSSLKIAAIDVLNDGATRISTGNLVWAAQSPDPLIGVGATIISTLIVAFSKAAKSLGFVPWKMESQWLVLAGMNGITSVSLLKSGVTEKGYEGLNALNVSIRELANMDVTSHEISAATFFIWGVGHTAMAFQGKLKAMIAYGTGNTMINQTDGGNFFSVGMAIAGMGKAIWDPLRVNFLRSADQKRPNSIVVFLDKHVTPAKLFAATHYGGAVASFGKSAKSAVMSDMVSAGGNFGEGMAKLFWAKGNEAIDREKNREIILDFVHVIDVKTGKSDEVPPPAAT